MNILTIVVLAVIIVFGMIGHARGFIRMLLSVLSLALTLYLATIISPAVSKTLQQTNLYDSVYDSTYDYINEKIAQSAADSMDGVMDELQLPESLKNYISSNSAISINGSGIAAQVATQITGIIFDVLVFLVTFIAAMVVVKLIFAAVNIVSHLPIIHGANQIAGLFVGIAEGLIFIWIFFIVISLMGSSEFAADMYRQINESPVLTFLYNNNIIMNALFK